MGTNLGIHRSHLSENLEYLMEQETDSLNAHLPHQVKGYVIWALGPKAKHEIMRGQWGKEPKDISLKHLIKLFKKTFPPARNVFHSRAQFFKIKQEDNNIGKNSWILEESEKLTESHQKK